jgi:hypothetical protein
MVSKMRTPAITLCFPEKCPFRFFILERQLTSQNMFVVRYSVTVAIVSQKFRELSMQVKYRE